MFIGVGIEGNVIVVAFCNEGVLYILAVVPILLVPRETDVEGEAAIPVIEIAGVEGSDEDNFLWALMLALGDTLVMVDEPACCMVSPNEGVFCWIGVTDIP